jgi:hypothetical protein
VQFSQAHYLRRKVFTLPPKKKKRETMRNRCGLKIDADIFCDLSCEKVDFNDAIEQRKKC